MHSLSTLRSYGYPHPRKTRFRLATNLGRAGLVTHRVRTKVSYDPAFDYGIVSSFTRLGLAHPRAMSNRDFDVTGDIDTAGEFVESCGQIP